jgi:hypothetical protein
MKPRKWIVAVALALWTIAGAGADPEPKEAAAAAAPVSAETDLSARADKRYEEMLGRMQAAVEEIAQLYGNPIFLQVFTNDVERATELKQRLRSAHATDAIQKEIKDLEGKRDELLNDIALKEREATRLSNRLARQRVALDVLAGAVEQARHAVEDTAK